MPRSMAPVFLSVLLVLLLAPPRAAHLAGQTTAPPCTPECAAVPCAPPPEPGGRNAPANDTTPVQEERCRDERDPAAAVLVADASGFQLRSADGSFSLHLRGGAQHDSRFFLGDPEGLYTDAFELRRVRSDLVGTLYRDFGFRLNLDFIGGRADVLDAFLEARLSPALRLRFGKTKGPVGLERLQTPFVMLFAERAFPTLLVPNREVGAFLDGSLQAGRVNYALALTNGVVDGGSDAGAAADSHELSARLFLHPFRGPATGPLQGLGIGVAATHGVQHGTVAAPALPGLRTSGRELFLRYRSDGTADGTARIHGTRTRLAPQGYLYWRNLGLLGEWVRSSFPVVRGEQSERLANTAWNLSGSVVLTGEDASYRGLRPRRPFNPAQGQWGALELAGRVHALQLDPAAFPTFADARWPKSATAFTVGVNWYLNPAVRALLNYERTTFAEAPGGSPRPPENLLVSRFQLAF